MAVHDVESDSSDCSNKFWTRPDANDESSEGYLSLFYYEAQQQVSISLNHGQM